MFLLYSGSIVWNPLKWDYSVKIAGYKYFQTVVTFQMRKFPEKLKPLCKN